jgi:hypothetical protein
MVSDPLQRQPANTRRRSEAALFWGLILIAAGVVSLALTLGIVPSPSEAVIGVIFGVAGVAILASYLLIHTHWWTLIAGPTLLGLAGAILLPGQWGGAIFLGATGLAFVLVFLTGPKRWWAVIPAGTMITLALIAASSNVISGPLSGALLFFGLAATFSVLAVLPVHGRRMSWPIFPAIGCLVFALLVATAGGGGEFVWPLLLVVAGILLMIRATTRHAGPPASSG